MKKIVIASIILLLAGSFSFAQEQVLGFSNTVYTGVGTGGMLDSNLPEKGGDSDVSFDGIVDYFTANIRADGITIAGDIAWSLFADGKLEAEILEWNFNAVMSPFANFDVGVGTNLDWTVGPKPFSGPSYSAYEVPEYAGLGILNNSVGKVVNHFADDAIAVQYSFDDLILVGAGLNGGLQPPYGSGTLGAGFGIKANILELFTIGFAYNGSFKDTGNIFYVGSSLYLVDGFDIDIWANIEPKNNTSVGGRVSFYKDAFRFAPEYTITFWSQDNKGVSMFAAIVAEMSLSDDILVGVNASWGLGSDANTESDASDAGARLNITPHFVWNLNERNRLSIGANLIPVWWQDDTSEFFWSIPISWRVLF